MRDSTACPVAELAREAARLVAAHRTNDEASIKARDNSAEHTRLGWEGDLIRDRLWTIEAEAAQHRARSAAGAMFQVMVAWDAANFLADMAATAGPEVRESHRRISGLLHSVLAMIEALGGVPRETVLADYYMGRRYDPHAALESALAGEGRHV